MYKERKCRLIHRFCKSTQKKLHFENRQFRVSIKKKELLLRRNINIIPSLGFSLLLTVNSIHKNSVFIDLYSALFCEESRFQLEQEFLLSESIIGKLSGRYLPE